METVKTQYDEMLKEIRANVKKAQSYVDTCNETLNMMRIEANKTLKNLMVMHYVIILAAVAGLIATGHSIKLIDIVICVTSILAVRPPRYDTIISVIPTLLLLILVVIRTIAVPFGDALEDYYMLECVFSIVFMIVDVIFVLRIFIFYPLDDDALTKVDICAVIIFTVTALTELVFVHFELNKGLCCAVLILALVMCLYAAKNVGKNTYDKPYFEKCKGIVATYPDIDAYRSADQLMHQVMSREDNKLASVGGYTFKGSMTNDTLYDMDSKKYRAEFTVKPDEDIKFLTSVSGDGLVDMLAWSVPVDQDSMDKYRNLPTRIRTECLKVRLFDWEDALMLGKTADIAEVRNAFVTLCRCVDLLALDDILKKAVSGKKPIKSMYEDDPAMEYETSCLADYRRQYFASGKETSPQLTHCLAAADKAIKNAAMSHEYLKINEPKHITA